MRTIDIGEAYKRKFARQDALAQRSNGKYQRHCTGSCAHVGRISQGCVTCFYSAVAWHPSKLPGICNVHCDYCFYHSSNRKTFNVGSKATAALKIADEERRSILRDLSMRQMRARHPEFVLYNFTSAESLAYLPVLEGYMDFLRRSADRELGVRGFAKLYTNGVLLTAETIARLRDSGFDEIRVHLGASDFSDEVYEGLRMAVGQLPSVVVETPAWPLHRDKLFAMLPIIEEIGVNHLNIDQIQVKDANIARIAEIYPDGEIFQGNTYFLDDGGLVEDLIGEVISQGYSYSILDCSFLTVQRSESEALHTRNIFAPDDPREVIRFIDDREPQGIEATPGTRGSAGGQ